MPLAKVKITIEYTGESFNALFNPEEYTVNKDNNYASQAIPGLSGPILQFVHGNMRTLEMELFFDTYDTPTLPKQDVRDLTNKLVNLLAIDPNLHAPPVVRISWASLQFRGVLARASQKFILFMDDGTPVRARVTCTFNEFIDPEQEAKQVNRQTADLSKVHVVAEGETLSGIASVLYEDPKLWRPIAINNNIDDPRSIFVGQQLLIPKLPFIDPETRQVVT
jgi:LysM repeat protein